jgi:dipeptidyl aminopeptidase/acylaminoacyl peptidase
MQPDFEELQPDFEGIQRDSDGPQPQSDDREPDSDGPDADSDGPEADSDDPQRESDGQEPDSDGSEADSDDPQRESDGQQTALKAQNQTLTTENSVLESIVRRWITVYWNYTGNCYHFLQNGHRLGGAIHQGTVAQAEAPGKVRCGNCMQM